MIVGQSREGLQDIAPNTPRYLSMSEPKQISNYQMCHAREASSSDIQDGPARGAQLVCSMPSGFDVLGERLFPSSVRDVETYGVACTCLGTRRRRTGETLGCERSRCQVG